MNFHPNTHSIEKNAVLDLQREYRYVLTRQWGMDIKNFVNFILLNPSTADEDIDDPTIKACMKFAQNWGFDGMYVTNLFAFRATKPNDLKNVVNPVGLGNDDYILEYSGKSKKVIVAWGNHGDYLNRAQTVIDLLPPGINLGCLQILKNGNPKHPLYVSRKTNPINYI